VTKIALQNYPIKVLEDPNIPLTIENIEIACKSHPYEVYRLIQHNGKFKEIKDNNRELYIKILSQLIMVKSLRLQSIEKEYQTEEMIYLALRYDCCYTIGYLKDQMTYEQWLYAIEHNPRQFNLVPSVFHTEKMIDLAMKIGGNIHFIENQTPELCMRALKIDKFSIRSIREQTEDLCMLAASGGAYASVLFQCKIITPKIAISAAFDNIIGNINHNSFYYPFHYDNIMQYGIQGYNI
jgi:hypothetical protein